MILPSRINLETMLLDLSVIAKMKITQSEIKDLSHDKLLDKVNEVLERLNCTPFNKYEKDALLYKQ